MSHLCLHWSLSSQLHFPVFPFPKTRLHVLFSSCSSPACFCPLLPVPLSSPSGSLYPPSRSLFLSPWASVPFFPVVYVPPHLCPSLSGSLSPSLWVSVYPLSLFFPLSQAPSASLSSCPSQPLYPCLSSVCLHTRLLSVSALQPTAQTPLGGEGEREHPGSQGKSVKVFLFWGKAVGLGGGPGLDSDFDTKLTHLKPHISFIWKH